MGRGRVRVKRNDLAKVAAAIKPEIASGLDETTNGMIDELRATVWLQWGYVKETIKDRDPSTTHSTISVGLNRDHGFYSRFNEWGTVKQAARPVVGPIAHAWEPKFVNIMTKHVRRACGGK